MSTRPCQGPCWQEATRTAARYSNPHALRPPWARTSNHIELDSSTPGRAVPVVCIQTACHDRARTGRKPETVSCSQMASKLALIREAAGRPVAWNDLLSCGSFGRTVKRLTTKVDHNSIG